jgi:hypothetical protein
MAVIKPEPSAPDEMAEGQELEVQHLVETTGLSPKQARELLLRYGNDWERIRKEAEALRPDAK